MILFHHSKGNENSKLRFLKNRPANNNDRILMRKLLKFLQSTIIDSQKNILIQKQIMKSLNHVYLFVLEEVPTMDPEAPNTHLLDLSYEIISFFGWLFSRMDMRALQKFLSQPTCFETILNYSISCLTN